MTPEPIRMTVRGETFRIRAAPDGSGFHYDWVGGRHDGDYGFSSASGSTSKSRSLEAHQTVIESFLDGVDPETGFME